MAVRMAAEFSEDYLKLCRDNPIPRTYEVADWFCYPQFYNTRLLLWGQQPFGMPGLEVYGDPVDTGENTCSGTTCWIPRLDQLLALLKKQIFGTHYQSVGVHFYTTVVEDGYRAECMNGKGRMSPSVYAFTPEEACYLLLLKLRK